MKSILPGCGMLAVVLAVFAADYARADDDPHEGCDRTFVDPAYGSSQFRQSCTLELSRRRAELAAWGIDAAGMSSLDSWHRYAAESVARNDARQEQERRDRLESERLAAERAKAQAEQEKVAAASARESERYAAQQMQAGQQMMREQDQMLKGLGVNLGGGTSASADCGDEYEPDEIRMYEVMIGNGVAPQCRHLKCEALVDCVDEVLDAEDE